MSTAMMAPEINLVRLDVIDLDDHPFAFPSAPGLTALKKSMAALGLLSPPWLRARKDGRWQVVAGLKRLRAAAFLKWDSVSAYALAPDTPDPHCLLISLHDNAFGRGFTLAEQVFFAGRLSSYWPEEKVAGEFLPLLGFPASVKILNRLLAAATLEAPWQLLLEQGRLALTAAARLARWQASDRAAALPFFQTLTFSQSKQEEFLEWLELLARREAASVAEILSCPELASCLKDPAMGQVEKATAVRHRLKAWVFPSLTAAQEAFDQRLTRSGLKQHPRIRLYPPPAFEGPDFLLEIRFRNAEELQKLLENLTRLAREKAFSEITSL